MKKLFKQSKNAFRNASISVAGLAIAGGANAAIDVAGVNTALTTAETSAHTVGTTVIAIVAGLTVIGIVIGLARKL